MTAGLSPRATTRPGDAAVPAPRTAPDLLVLPGERRREVVLPTGRIVVGRGRGCDVVVDHPGISEEHLSIEARGTGRWQVRDLGSRNGTFHGGAPVRATELAGPARLHLGHPSRGLPLDLVPPPAHGHDAAHAAGVVLEGVTVRRGGSVLLDAVDVTFPHGRLTTVIGPSGAGKSTLLAVATGALAPTSGRVLLAGTDVLALDPVTRGTRIGVVPQDDVLHLGLPLRTSLRCSARLLLPPTTTREQRDDAVDQVLEQLRLTERARLRIDRLSGGQRKRANAAAALLTQPDLLVLDEPTSGLDPHLERAYLTDLAGLAEAGRTVVVVTHSPAAVELADHVVVVSAGKVAYQGPAAGLSAHFGADGLGTVFAQVGSAEADRWTTTWAAQVAPADPRRTPLPPPPAPTTSRGHQFLPLLGRNVRLLAADRAGLFLLLLQAPVLGLLTRLFPDGGGFASASSPNTDIRTVLLDVVLAATWLGTLAAIRQVVDERRIVDRELSAGVSPLAYVGARAALLAALVVVQVLGLVATAFAGRDLPAGRVVGTPGVELVLTLVLTGWAAAAVGLLVSSAVRTGAGAAALAPLVVIPQLLLCGALMRVDDPVVLDLASRAITARAGFSAAAASVDLVGLEGAPGLPAAWAATSSAWATGLAQLAVLVVLALGGVLLALRRSTRTAVAR